MGVQHTIEEGRNCKSKSDERAGRADIEEGAGGANGRTDHDEGAKGADERRKGNEEGVAGVNVMMAAGEEVA